MKRTIVICGNGASAAILLNTLAKRADAAHLSVLVIGTHGPIGAGIAYATQNPHHLLNVPAARMSALPAQPEDFHDWLKRRDGIAQGFASQFVPRMLYGEYLEDLVRRSRDANPTLTTRLVACEVVSLIRDKLHWLVACDQGAPIMADIVVLATGNDMPTPVRSRHAPEIAPRIVDNPWDVPRIEAQEDVLILGSGLTAVDAVIGLLDRGHTGMIHLLSRHGLLPATHVQPDKIAPLEPPRTARGLLQALRAAAGNSAAQWQGLMDAMRPSLPAIWQSLPDAEKRRFLRHGVTYWNVHRHRLAPQVGARLEQALQKNVRLHKGRLTGLEAARETGLQARIGTKTLAVQRVINCTGPNSDPGKSHDPLIENLIASRQARATAVGVGLDVDARNRVLDGDGVVQPSLFAMGALTRGRWWEITAIPEISHQADELSGHIMAQLSLLDAAHRTHRKAS